MSPKPHLVLSPQAKPRLFSAVRVCRVVAGLPLHLALQFLAEKLWRRLGDKMLSCVPSRFWRAVDQRAVISRTSGFPSISVLFSLTVTSRIQNSKLLSFRAHGNPPNSSVSASLICKGGWPWDRRQGWSLRSTAQEILGKRLCHAPCWLSG